MLDDLNKEIAKYNTLNSGDYGIFLTQEQKDMILNFTKKQLLLHNVVRRRELLLAAICEYNKYNTQKDIKAVDDWLKDWDIK